MPQTTSEMLCTQFCHLWDFRARRVQFQVLVNIYSVQRVDFIQKRHNGRVGTFSSRDCVDQGSNPGNFTRLVWIFIIASGMSERSFCIFRRIHLRLTLVSRVAYECFSFTAVPRTDLTHFNLESSLGYAWLTGQFTQTGQVASPEPESHGYLEASNFHSWKEIALHVRVGQWLRLPSSSLIFAQIALDFSLLPSNLKTILPPRPNTEL